MAQCEEVWRDIKGYEGLYQVSNAGNIKSLPRNGTINKERIMALGAGRYLHIGLRKNGIKRTMLVHRLVAEAFIPNHQNLPCIDHIDGNPFNNNTSNLRWCTHKQNSNNPITTKRRYVSCRLGGKHLGKPIMQIDKLGNVVNVFDSIHEASRVTNIERSNIMSVLNNKTKFIKNKYTVHCVTAGGYKWKYA